MEQISIYRTILSLSEAGGRGLVLSLQIWQSRERHRKKGEGNKWDTNTAEHLETLNITEWKLGKRKKSTLKKFNSTINEYILTNIDF